MSSHDDTMGSSHTEFLCNQFCASRRAHFGEEPRLTIAKVIVARWSGQLGALNAKIRLVAHRAEGVAPHLSRNVALFLLFVPPFAESMSPSAILLA